MSDTEFLLQVVLSRTKAALETFQGMLNFDGWEGHVHYKDLMGVGRSGLIGSVLGAIGGFHLCLFLFMLLFTPNGLLRSTLVVWSLYVLFLATFHFLEFFVTSLQQPHSLSTDSFIINHSLNYTIAILASFIEFWLEVLIFGRNRFQYQFTFLLGVLLVIGGQYFRSLAMWQCGESFNHIIAHEKPAYHKLQTKGVYHYLRHPSYFGWFYWTLGMQLVIGNFWCLCAFAYFSWTFFRGRIPYEEHFLWQFYGKEYQAYVARTYIGIPFIFSKIPPLQNQEKSTNTTDNSTTTRNNSSDVSSCKNEMFTTPDKPTGSSTADEDENSVEKSSLSVLEEDDEDYELVKMASNVSNAAVVPPDSICHNYTSNNMEIYDNYEIGNTCKDIQEATTKENEPNLLTDKKND